MEQKSVTQQQPASAEDPPLNNGEQPKANDASLSPEAKKPSLPKRLWIASGLNLAILIMMFKGAIAPTIGLAIYQATPIADIYTTVGYLVAVISVLGMSILPRSKFVFQRAFI